MASPVVLSLVVVAGAVGAPGAPSRVVGLGAGPGVLWRFATGVRPLATVPVVGPDGTIFVVAGNGVLYAVAPGGLPRWTLSTGVVTGGPAASRPAVGPDGTSYWNVAGSIVAVDPRGRLRWTFLSTGGGSPVYTRGHVLFAAGPYLYAITPLGPAAGHAAWRAAIGGTTVAGQGPSPAVGLDGTAYVASSDGRLYAIAPNGTRRWSFSAGIPLQFSPAVGPDGTVYVDAFANGHGALYALTPAGRPRWRVAVPAGSDVARGPDGTVYVAAHVLLAYSSRGRLLWHRVVDAAAPVDAGPPGHLVLVPTLLPPALLAFGPGGALRWRLPLSDPAVGPPARGAGGLLYSGDYAGTLTALAPGARGPGRLVRGAARPAPSTDLGADNPPFIARGAPSVWRVTLARTIERSRDGGTHWQTVLTPGVSSPDRRTGLYRNARYGDVTFLAVDPRDPRGLYVGTVGALGDYLLAGKGGAAGGLYYSPDGARNWRRLTSGLPYTMEPRLRVPTYGLDSLVFDPARRGLLYAQTLPAYGSPGRDAGLYASADGGRHWRLAAHGLRPVYQDNALLGVYRVYPPGVLLVDRGRPRVLFLVAPTGFYRSDNGARGWERVHLVRYADPASVAVRIGIGGVVRVSTDVGVYRSADYGAHWAALPPRHLALAG